MPRPLIGVTAYLEAARWGTWVREAVLSPPAYARAVEKVGGVPVVLPPLGAGGIDDYLRALDGLILAGGVELDPATYGEVKDDRLEEPQPHRDYFELALCRAAVQADLPILAIDRGMHVLNVAQGGSLIRWLPDAVKHDRHEAAAPHVLQVSVSSVLGKAIGDHAEIAFSHKQALNRLGNGVLAVAWADDQIVEGIEIQGHRFAVGVQWHPERGGDLSLFQALIEAAG